MIEQSPGHDTDSPSDRSAARWDDGRLVFVGNVARAQDDDEPENGRGKSRNVFVRSSFDCNVRRRLAEYKNSSNDRIAVVPMERQPGSRDHSRTPGGSTQRSPVPLPSHGSPEEKLQLAGRGDIKRFMDRLDPIVKSIRDANAGECSDSRPKCVTCRKTLEGLFDDGLALFQDRGHDAEPGTVAENERALRDKNSAWYRDAVTDTVRRLARLADLSDAQREELSKLILTETTPPRKIRPV